MDGQKIRLECLKLAIDRRKNNVVDGYVPIVDIIAEADKMEYFVREGAWKENNLRKG